MAASTNNPLNPNVLHAAGVPLDDALWFTKVPDNRKVLALMCSRGVKILNHVRQHLGVITPACNAQV